MLTIKDIALLAGVSISTVSKALNNDPKIRTSTRMKITKIAEKHGYQKNILATQLVSGRSKIIGFVLGELTNPLYSLIAKELDNKLKAVGYRMISVMTSDGIELLYQLKVDGCIVWDTATAKIWDSLQPVKGASMPCFILGPIDHSDSPYMNIDRKTAIGKAVEYLMSYGHRRIGFIGNSQAIKVQGFKEALNRNGLSYSPQHILPGGTSWEDGYFAMLHYEITESSPTAFIGLNNLVTKGAMRAILEKGLKVPEDISLIGYDHSPDMQYAEVAITTVGPSLEELTAIAAEQIVALINGNQAEYPIYVETRIDERDSVTEPK